MILRRFMKHVTDQNWFAVGLDVIVVITGIFLGMQVTEWNNEREAQVQLKKITFQMIQDTKTAITNIDTQVSINEIRIKNGLLVLDILDGKELTPDLVRDFEDGLNDVNKMSLPSIGVGALGSYMSGELLNTSFDENLEASLRDFENITRTELDIINHLVSRLDIENVTLSRFFAMTIVSIPELKQRYDLKAMRTSNEYINAYQSSLSLQAAYISRVSEIRESLILLLQTLEKNQ